MANRREILAQYLKTSPDDLKYLGSGNFAEVYLYKNKAYKITRDLDDYLMATKLIKVGKKFDCFVKVYKTRIFKLVENDYNTNLYLIVSEYVTPLDKSDDDEVHRIWRDIASENDTRDYLVGDQETVFPDKLKPTPLALDLFEQMNSILRLYKKWGMKCWDNPPRNLAYVDGKIKIFDFGFSALKGSGEYRYSKKKTVTFNINEIKPLESSEFKIVDFKSTPFFSTKNLRMNSTFDFIDFIIQNDIKL